MNFGLTQDTIKLIKQVFAKYPEIELVKMLGSRAMGNYKYNSDIDLAIFGKFSWDFAPHIREELDSLPTPYLYDVTDYNTTESDELKKHIDEYGKVFYEKG